MDILALEMYAKYPLNVLKKSLEFCVLALEKAETEEQKAFLLQMIDVYKEAINFNNR